MCKLFALVPCEIDNTTAVVSARNIKDFCPVTCEDMNPDLLYDVFWSGSMTTKGGYYHAQIVNMKKKKATNDKDVNKRQRDLDPLQKIELENHDLVPRKKYMEVLRKLHEKTKALEQCQKLNEQLQEALCTNIKKADCFQCQKSGAEENAPLYYVDFEGQGEANKPGLDTAWSSLSAMTVECNIRKVNASYDSASQAAVSQPAAPLPARESGEAELGAVMVNASQAPASQPNRPPAPTSGEGEPRAMIVNASQAPVSQPTYPQAPASEEGESGATMVNASQAPASQPTHPPAPASGDGESGATMVVIGCHILIPSKKWEDLPGLIVDSRFTKEAATSIWGAGVLKGKSPTGRLSNKAKALGHTEAFPPLTPEKVDALRSFFISRLTDNGIPMEQAVKRAKLIRKFLSEKCTDARR
ncbi:uncharacterized protein LOC115327754 [Ixodes scapularis]|uniref:uncharacterized protein LOC115327754 n=1 Tax=Ixodes scapularis TaxID=6945 RepID=UPI001161742C|nr:uncharacterized protein LOC115327754 [Ixodes scapularis]